MAETLIVIPAREQASRLPRKPLADIAGVPMIVHVWRRAVESNAGRVVVATDSEEICTVVGDAGGEPLGVSAQRDEKFHSPLDKLSRGLRLRHFQSPNS